MHIENVFVCKEAKRIVILDAFKVFSFNGLVWTADTDENND